DRDAAARWRLARPARRGSGGAAGARRRDVGAGAAQVGALGRADRRRDPGDVAPGALRRERRGGRPALVRAGAAAARRGARGMKPDDSRLVWDGKLIDVVVERWGDNEREIVEHPGAVAIVAVDVDGQVAFVRQLREAVRAWVLELPAGTREDGEEPLATAK